MYIIANSYNTDKNHPIYKKDAFYILNKENLTYEKLNEINPEYVFFPHWSYIIPSKIYENFNCIIFHMTDLPFGRGGSPLQNLISRGIYKTKISAIRCSSILDGGDIYLKKDLDLSEGKASEIYAKAGIIVSQMIDEIVSKKMKPTPQKGEPICFKRRTPAESNMSELENLRQVYDYIRMLDAEGYPKAFLINNKKIRFEFNDASFEDGKISAHVEIMKDE